MRKRIALLAVAILCATALVMAGHDTKGVDGTSWTVEVEPDQMARDKGEKQFKDSLMFVEGKLIANEGKKLGFDAAPYKLSRTGENAWTFVAEQSSSEQGKYLWSGKIEGNDMQGKLVWTKNDKTTLTYDFHGDKKD